MQCKLKHKMVKTVGKTIHKKIGEKCRKTVSRIRNFEFQPDQPISFGILLLELFGINLLLEKLFLLVDPFKIIFLAQIVTKVNLNLKQIFNWTV